MAESSAPPEKPGQENKFKLWLKRIGLVGFLFFLIKGLIWLAVFYFGADFLKGILTD